MNFERYKNPLVALGLGEFAIIEDKMIKFFNERIASLKPVYKNITDSGNQNKFLIYIPYGTVENEKTLNEKIWQLDQGPLKEGFTRVATNYYRRQKFFRKYGFPKPGLLVEIIYYK